MTRVLGARNLVKAIQNKKKEDLANFKRGALKAGFQLQAWSMDIVPVMVGNLKASAYTRLGSSTPNRVVVLVGYTASYAIIVHEDLELRHGQDFNDWYRELIDDPDSDKKIWFDRGPNQQAKYLEQPLRQNRARLLGIMRDEINQ